MPPAATTSDYKAAQVRRRDELSLKACLGRGRVGEGAGSLPRPLACLPSLLKSRLSLQPGSQPPTSTVGENTDEVCSSLGAGIILFGTPSVKQGSGTPPRR